VIDAESVVQNCRSINIVKVFQIFRFAVSNSTTSPYRLLLGLFFQLFNESREAKFHEFPDADRWILFYEPVEDSVD
jgi:hypothetical protein